jgi:hypothetical protein
VQVEQEPPVPNDVPRLSCEDKSAELQVSPDGMEVSGFKGYRMVRATHGVGERSQWFFEFKLLHPPVAAAAAATAMTPQNSNSNGVVNGEGDDVPAVKTEEKKAETDTDASISSSKSSSDSNSNSEVKAGQQTPIAAYNPNAAVRVGICSKVGHLEGPVGFDRYSYGFGSKKGVKLHESTPVPYGEPFTWGDVIGCRVSLASFPEREALDAAEIKNGGDPEINDLQKVLANKVSLLNEGASLHPLHGSEVEFYKNGVSQGVAFSDVFASVYYPAISLYMGGRVRLNCGPDFDFPVTTRGESEMGLIRNPKEPAFLHPDTAATSTPTPTPTVKVEPTATMDVSL